MQLSAVSPLLLVLPHRPRATRAPERCPRRECTAAVSPEHKHKHKHSAAGNPTRFVCKAVAWTCLVCSDLHSICMAAPAPCKASTCIVAPNFARGLRTARALHAYEFCTGVLSAHTAAESQHTSAGAQKDSKRGGLQVKRQPGYGHDCACAATCMLTCMHSQHRGLEFMC